MRDGGRRTADVQQKVRTPHSDVGKNASVYLTLGCRRDDQISAYFDIIAQDHWW